MSLDLGTQNFMENTLTIFSLTIQCSNLKSYGLEASLFLYDVEVLVDM